MRRTRAEMVWKLPKQIPGLVWMPPRNSSLMRMLNEQGYAHSYRAILPARSAARRAEKPVCEREHIQWWNGCSSENRTCVTQIYVSKTNCCSTYITNIKWWTYIIYNDTRYSKLTVEFNCRTAKVPKGHPACSLYCRKVKFKLVKHLTGSGCRCLKCQQQYQDKPHPCPCHGTPFVYNRLNAPTRENCEI